MTPNDKMAIKFLLNRIKILDERIDKLESIIENKFDVYIPKK